MRLDVLGVERKARESCGCAVVEASQAAARALFARRGAEARRRGGERFRVRGLALLLPLPPPPRLGVAFAPHPLYQSTPRPPLATAPRSLSQRILTSPRARPSPLGAARSRLGSLLAAPKHSTAPPRRARVCGARSPPSMAPLPSPSPADVLRVPRRSIPRSMPSPLPDKAEQAKRAWGAPLPGSGLVVPQPAGARDWVPKGIRVGGREFWCVAAARRWEMRWANAGEPRELPVWAGQGTGAVPWRRD